MSDAAVDAALTAPIYPQPPDYNTIIILHSPQWKPNYTRGQDRGGQDRVGLIRLVFACILGVFLLKILVSGVVALYENWKCPQAMRRYPGYFCRRG